MAPSPLLVVLIGPLGILAVLIVAACLSYYDSKNGDIPSGVAASVALVFVVIIAFTVFLVLNNGGAFSR